MKTNTTQNPSRSDRQPQRFLFRTNEAAKVSGLSACTIKWWIKRRWLNPVRTRRGNEFTCWQVLGMCVVAFLNTRIRTHQHSYLDRKVIRALQTLSAYDDKLLFNSGDSMTQATAILSGLFDSPDLTPEEMGRNVIRGLEAIRENWLARN